MKKQIFKKMISIVFATTLAVTGISFSGADTATMTANAREYDIIYEPNIARDDNAEEFYIGDTTLHTFYGEVFYYDEEYGYDIPLDEDGHNITYEWKLGDSGCFEIVGSSDSREIQLRLTKNASSILGDKYYIDDSLELEITLDGKNIGCVGMPLTLNAPFVKDIKDAYISPNVASFDNNHRSAQFQLEGLNNIDESKLEWSFDYYDDNQFFTVTGNGRKATVSLRDDAEENWDNVIGGDASYYQGCLICKVLSDDSDQYLTIPNGASLYYYHDDMFQSLSVFITESPDEKYPSEDYLFDLGEKLTLYACFDDTSISPYLTNVKYSWTLDADAAKFLEISGSSNSSSLNLKAKSEADFGNELKLYGLLTLSVTSDQIKTPLKANFDVGLRKICPDIEFDRYSLSLSDNLSTRQITIKNANDDVLSNLVSSFNNEDDYKIFDIKRNGSTVTVSLNKNAADYIAANDLAYYDEDNIPYYSATIIFRLVSPTGNTAISLDEIEIIYYLEELYEVTFSPSELDFDRGVPAEKAVTAEVKKKGTENIVYEWSLDEDDDVALNSFTLAAKNSKTVKVRYNGYDTQDQWFRLVLKIKVNGQYKPLSEIINIHLKDKETTEDDTKKPGEAKTPTPSAEVIGETPVVNTDNKTAPTPASKGTTITLANSNTNGVFVVNSSDEGAPSVTYKAASNKKAKTINIPKTVRDTNNIEYKVTKIGAKAFKKNKKVTSVSIPSTVTTIEKDAFNGCSKLKTIKLNANTLKTVKSGAFKNIKKGATFTISAKDRKTFDKLVSKLKKAGAKGCNFKFKKAKN